MKKSKVTALLTVLVFASSFAQTGSRPAPVGTRVPVKIAVEWLGSGESKIVLDTVLAYLAKQGFEHVPFKDYWNFCVYVGSDVARDPQSGINWYAVSIQVFNRLEFFSGYHGIPFDDHEAFVHQFEIINEPEFIDVISQNELRDKLFRTLDRLNREVFSTVQSFQ